MNMHNPASTEARLSIFSDKEGLHIHEDDFTVTNGPVISPNRKFLFFNDTLRGTVYRYRLSADAGKLSDRRFFIKFSSDQGYPDGMCFDVEGNLWIALWGGASIVQLDTTGKLFRKIAIPALNVTHLCFCGPGFNRLLVSTAAIGLSEEETRLYPASGALFEISNHRSASVAPYPATLDPLWT
jgi:D-xylonolactonase